MFCGGAHRASYWTHGAKFCDRLVVARGEEPSDHADDLLDRLGPVQHRLVRSDVVVGDPHLDDVDRAQRHPAELLDLAIAREDPGAVCAELALFLDDDSELEREPEDLGEEQQVVPVGQPARREAGEAVELAERRRRQ